MTTAESRLTTNGEQRVESRGIVSIYMLALPLSAIGSTRGRPLSSSPRQAAPHRSLHYLLLLCAKLDSRRSTAHTLSHSCYVCVCRCMLKLYQTRHQRLRAIQWRSIRKSVRSSGYRPGPPVSSFCACYNFRYSCSYGIITYNM